MAVIMLTTAIFGLSVALCKGSAPVLRMGLQSMAGTAGWLWCELGPGLVP